MDPQQRKLFEVVYECLEDAGMSMQDISGSNTAVFVSNFTVDYSVMMTKEADYMHRYSATALGTSILSNCISHVLNLHGPRSVCIIQGLHLRYPAYKYSFTVDTACSSTIYAFHMAILAIQSGDCDAAIIAGANLIMSPEQHLGTTMGGFISPTSACHIFDVSADGYARAKVVNAIYIERVSSAFEVGRKIHAVIHGTAINS